IVSKQWRNYIYSASILWNCISARGHKGNALSNVVQGLKLSRDLPLTVIIKVWPSLWKKICPYLLDHRDRIVTVVTFHQLIEPGETQRKQLAGAEMLRELAPLPNLRIVKGDWGYGNFREIEKGIIHQSHSLECFEGPSLDSELLLEAKRNSTLREFYTHQELVSLLSILEGMPSVRKISVFTYGGPIQESLSLSSRSAKPFNWTHFKDYSQKTPLVSLFHRLPLLTCLKVMLRVDKLEEVTSSLHELQCLREYMVYITPIDWIPIPLVEPNPPVKPNPTIRYMEFDAVSLQTMRINPPERKGDIIANFSERLSKAAPGVKSMLLWADGPTLSHWKLDTYDELEKLNIRLSDKEMNIRFPSSLRALCIETGATLEGHISSPNISTLEIKVLYHADIIDAQEAFLDLGEWPAVEVASLQSHFSRLRGASLSSLRKITLTSIPYSQKIDINITLFIKDIAEEVDRYPCLEEIHMDECPEFDILMIMLERRNILANPGIKPIKRLSLPSTCPFAVSQLLPGLLAGKWVQRPSNFKLSQAGNARSILDSTKPGCFTCLRILRTCDAPLNTASSDESAREMLLSDLERYPDSEDEILAT
ncbi:hypothetical protein CPB86DRAFT_779099, partial [Serendipita vermifera]